MKLWMLPFGSLRSAMFVIVYVSTRGCIYPTPPHKQDMTIFKWSLKSLNSKFSFSLTGYHIKLKEPSWMNIFSKIISAM